MYPVAGEICSTRYLLNPDKEDADIHYSFDGSFPDNYYPKYTKPFVIPKDALDVRVVTYRNGKQVGKQIKLPVAELEKRVKRK